MGRRAPGVRPPQSFRRPQGPSHRGRMPFFTVFLRFACVHKTRVVRRCFCARVSSFCILSIALYATRAAHLDTAFSSLYLPGVQKALWLPPRAPNLTKRSRRTTPNFAENNRRISPKTFRMCETFAYIHIFFFKKHAAEYTRNASAEKRRTSGVGRPSVWD